MIYSSPSLIVNIGLAFTIMIAMAGIAKRLRSNRTLLAAGIAALAVGIAGFLIRSESTEAAGGNAADFLFGPLIYVLSYGLLRKVYKSIYHCEPTYVWLSGYDIEEMRRVNLLDRIVHVLPLLLAMVLPFFGKMVA